MNAAPRYIPFTQLELTSSIGVEPGRYFVGDSDGSGGVLLVGTFGGSAARMLPRSWGRSSRAAEATGSSPVPLAVATLARPADGFADAGEGAELIKRLKDGERLREDLVGAAIDAVNTAIGAYRAAARDPFLVEITRDDARAVRLGWGTAEQLDAAGWEQAISVEPTSAGRVAWSQTLEPATRVAEALSGADPVKQSEELLVRVLLDLAMGRRAAALLGMAAAAELGRAEGLLGESLGAELQAEARVLADAELSAPGTAETSSIEKLARRLDSALAGR